MIQVTIKTNTIRGRVVTAEVSDTPMNVFTREGIDVAGSVPNLDGMTLGVADLNATFEALNVRDGSQVRLNSVVKADGAF